jgi:hypothetical protein
MMKVQLESTTKIVELVVDGVAVPARIWEGRTENGVACHAYITRIAVSNDDSAEEFERDLQEQKAPSEAIKAIPLRMIL